MTALDVYEKLCYMISRTEAAALIDDYARRVPRAMLEEIEKQAFEYGKEQFLSYESIDAIAAKYGVKLDDNHEYQ